MITSLRRPLSLHFDVHLPQLVEQAERRPFCLALTSKALRERERGDGHGEGSSERRQPRLRDFSEDASQNEEQWAAQRIGKAA
eukprot:g16494.t1